MILVVGKNIVDYYPENKDEVAEYYEMINEYGFKDTRSSATRIINSLELCNHPELYKEMTGGKEYVY